MTKRSMLMIAAFGLVACLGPAVSSQAGGMYKIQVSEQFNLTANDATSNTLAGATLTFTLPTGVVPSGAIEANSGSITGTGYQSTGGGNYSAVATSIATAGNTVTVSFSPDANHAALTANFIVVTTTDSLSTLESQIKLSSAVVSGTGTFTAGSGVNPTFTLLGTVPEPASMAMLGIGMAGLISFRRIFKRKATV